MLAGCLEKESRQSGRLVAAMRPWHLHRCAATLRCAPMTRIFLCLLLCGILAARAAEERQAPADFQAKRQAALVRDWMEAKRESETPAQFLARLMDAAREGDARAMATVGSEFRQRQDDGRAAHWWRQAAENGNSLAAYLLASLYASEAARDEEQSLAWLRRAAEAGLAEAQMDLGNRCAEGRGVELDPAAARIWHRQAAEGGYLPAWCNLATLEMQGRGGAQDLQSAAGHFQKAADAGIAQGFFGIAETRRLQNRMVEAARAYEQAAAAGIAEADFWLGCLYAEGAGKPRDDAKAAAHFIKAAEAGHPTAQAVAGDFLRRGIGVAADPEGAQRWTEEARKCTNPDATVIIGRLFLDGRLVQRNLPQALYFLQHAAQRGSAYAQRWAGALLATGEAGERDLERAYVWLWLAARQGDTEAEKAFQTLLPAMSGEQILQAARKAAEWKVEGQETKD